jgi:hypothetical protein
LREHVSQEKWIQESDGEKMPMSEIPEVPVMTEVVPITPKMEVGMPQDTFVNDELRTANEDQAVIGARAEIDQQDNIIADRQRDIDNTGQDIAMHRHALGRLRIQEGS